MTQSPSKAVKETIQSRVKSGPILIIAGMHRSGTSYVSSILKESGLHVGSHLDKGSAGNIKGHFENFDFVTLHAQVLKHHSLSASGWTTNPQIQVPESFYPEMEKMVEQNAQSGPWGWKDPRTTLFLDFWHSELPDAKFLFVYRSPWEVVDSLFRRGDKAFQENPTLALDVWAHYNRKVLSFIKAHPNICLLAHVDAVAQREVEFVSLIKNNLQIPLADRADSTFDPSLLRKEPKGSSRSAMVQQCFPDVFAVWMELERSANMSMGTSETAKNETTTASLREIGEPIVRDWMELRRAQNAQAQAQKEVKEVEQKLETANQEIDWIKQSRVWKLRCLLSSARDRLAGR